MILKPTVLCVDDELCSFWQDGWQNKGGGRKTELLQKSVRIYYQYVFVIIIHYLF